MSSEPRSHSSERPTVAIVGGGMAGLVAAAELTASGHDVHVFDKGRGAGGRASTRRDGAGRFDHGAQYFTVGERRFRDRVDTWIEEGVAARWHGRIATIGAGEIRSKVGSTARFVGTPAMNSVVKSLANGARVQFGVRIDSAERASGGWRVVDTTGERVGGFDTLILALPPEQALPFLESAGSPLEERARPVRSLPCWAVMASFEQRLPIEFDGAFVESSSLAWIARDSSKPGRPAGERWVLHGADSWSDEHLEREADEVARELLGTFFRETGVEPVSPQRLNAHRWRFAKAANPLDVGCLWDSERRIGACGDWCEACRIEGAFLSGLEMARRVTGGPVRPGRDQASATR